MSARREIEKQMTFLSFEEFLERFPLLLDGRLLDAHYSPGLLAGADSRARWVEPDRRPLPAPAG